MLSTLQTKRFFGAIRAAAENLNEAPELYRKRVMKEELGVEHLRDVTKTTGFDTLMRRVLGDAGQYEAALEYVGGDVKRMRYIAIECATKIIVSQGNGVPDRRACLRYIASIFVQMNLTHEDRDSLAFRLDRDDGWDDFTTASLKKVVAALQKHVRRRT